MSDQRNAFIDSGTHVLKCHGYVESNEAGDIKIPVAEDFNLKPGKFKTDDNGATWAAYP